MEKYNDDLLAKALEECNNAVIQFPEAIQPHGMLFVMNEDFEILRTSHNTQQFLNIPAENFFNQNLNQFFELPTNFRDYYNPISEMGGDTYFQTFRQNEVTFISTGQTFISTLTPVGNSIVMELEEKPKELETFNPFTVFKEILTEGNQHREDLNQLLYSAIKKVQMIIGYDRVMVYKFAPDWHGEVIAEVNTGSLPSYLGLHFPASDIPAQARVLFSKNWIRTIPDVYYQAVPIISQDSNANAIDLSQVSLRSIFPIHIQYLKNIKVAASASIPIMSNNKLWGIMACHHHKAKIIPPSKRNLCEFIGQALSLQVDSYEKYTTHLKKEKLSTELEIITGRLFENTKLFPELSSLSQRLMKLVDAQGLWIVWKEKEEMVGDIPDTLQERQQLLNFLKGYFRSHDKPCVTNQLSKKLDVQFTKGIGGVLAISVSLSSDFYLIWTRSEKDNIISWAGEPEKKIILEDNRVKLMPRHSFEVWKEVTKGNSKPWSEQDIETVTTLKTSILSNLLLNAENLREAKKQLEREVRIKTKDLQAIREELEESVMYLKESNEELKNFAYFASHDLQEPLRQISTFTQLMEQRIQGKLDEKENKYLDLIVSGTKRMQDLIDDLLQYSRLTRKAYTFTKVDLNKVIDKVFLILSPTIEESQAEIQVQHLPEVYAKEVLLQQLFQNLLMNAIKYQAKGNIPKINISYEELEDYWQFVVEDNGIGIEPEFYDTIFELFRRLHTKMEYTGNGIGLTLCKKIVNQHNGEIWLTSKLGKGSRFYFTISKNIAITSTNSEGL